MKKTHLIPAILMFISAMTLLSGSLALAEVRYTVTDLGTLPGGSHSTALSINSKGQVVGYADTASGSQHAFLYSGGVMSDLGSLGGDSIAWAINDSGQVVGSSSIVSGFWPSHAFLYSGGVMTDIGTLYGGDSMACGINAGGQIVGVSDGRVFMYSGGVITDLGLNADIIHTPSINDSGQIAGYYYGAFGYHAFLYSEGVTTDIDISAPNYARSSINTSGQFIGTYIMGYGNTHGFVYSEGVFTSLGDNTVACYYLNSINNSGQIVGTKGYYILFSGGVEYYLSDLIDPSSGWDLQAAVYGTFGIGIEPVAINNLGQIAGTGTNPSGQRHAFLLTPITLPTNTAPVASSGPDQIVYAWIDGIAEANLNGSGSYDEDNDPLTYKWTWTINGNTYTANGVKPTIELPVGQYVISLIINDSTVDSEPDYVNVNVNAALQARLSIIPATVSRRDRLQNILAMMELPKGIKKSDLKNEHFVLYPDYSEEGIEANWQYVYTLRQRVEAIILFNKAELMNAIPNNVRVQLYVVGQLTSGQYFFGSDTIRIIR
jgi:probable HAF family extracellular repeat protein